MSEFKVFYSWQSDLPNATNRGFIGDALEKACKQIANNPEVDESPRVDQDTQGVPGSPPIPATIMEKIDECKVFVADVSFCYKAEDGTLAPNPNVAYELGYAVARLGWDRIVLIVNESFGRVEKLPFDLEKRRAVPYSASEGEPNRSEAKSGLVRRIKANIEVIAQLGRSGTQDTPAELAQDAISSQSPNRVLKVREFMGWVIAKLQEGDPGAIDPQAFVDCLEVSRPTLEAFSSVVEVASIADDPTSIREIWRQFEKILANYDVPANHSGVINDSQHDWWRFHGYEMCVIVAAYLLREGKISVLRDLTSAGFIQRRWQEIRNTKIVDFRVFSEYVRSIHMWNERLKSTNQESWISPYGRVLSQRYETSSTNHLEWQEFCEADFLLALVGLSRERAESYPRWNNWTHIYLKGTPRVILDARKIEVARDLRSLLGFESTSELKQWLKDQWSGLETNWAPFYRRRDVPVDDIEAIDSIS